MQGAGLGLGSFGGNRAKIPSFRPANDGFRLASFASAVIRAEERGGLEAHLATQLAGTNQEKLMPRSVVGRAQGIFPSSIRFPHEQPPPATPPPMCRARYTFRIFRPGLKPVLHFAHPSFPLLLSLQILASRKGRLYKRLKTQCVQQGHIGHLFEATYMTKLDQHFIVRIRVDTSDPELLYNQRRGTLVIFKDQPFEISMARKERTNAGFNEVAMANPVAKVHLSDCDTSESSEELMVRLSSSPAVPLPVPDPLPLPTPAVRPSLVHSSMDATPTKVYIPRAAKPTMERSASFSKLDYVPFLPGPDGKIDTRRMKRPQFENRLLKPAKRVKTHSVQPKKAFNDFVSFIQTHTVNMKESQLPAIMKIAELLGFHDNALRIAGCHLCKLMNRSGGEVLNVYPSQWHRCMEELKSEGILEDWNEGDTHLSRFDILQSTIYAAFSDLYKWQPIFRLLPFCKVFALTHRSNFPFHLALHYARENPDFSRDREWPENANMVDLMKELAIGMRELGIITFDNCDAELTFTANMITSQSTFSWEEDVKMAVRRQRRLHEPLFDSELEVASNLVTLMHFLRTKLPRQQIIPLQKHAQLIYECRAKQLEWLRKDLDDLRVEYAVTKTESG